MRFLPYKHPLLGWYFNWKFIYLIDGCLYIGKIAFKWQSKQSLKLKPKKIKGYVWAINDIEPNMYIWLKFNISFSGGLGIGLVYK